MSAREWYRCGAFYAVDARMSCVLESDHDGPHIMPDDVRGIVVQIRDLTRDLAAARERVTLLEQQSLPPRGDPGFRSYLARTRQRKREEADAARVMREETP